jgi:hypothetical protein
LYLNKEKARKKLTKAGAIKLLKYIKNRLIQNNIKIETDALYSNYLDLIECWLKKPNVNTLQQILSTYSTNHQTRKRYGNNTQRTGVC